MLIDLSMLCMTLCMTVMNGWRPWVGLIQIYFAFSFDSGPFLCMYLFYLYSHMRLDILYCFIMWFRCHGSWLWVCPLQLRPYAPKYFWWCRLESRDLILATVLSLYHGFNASTFSSSCVVSYCLCFCLMSISNFYCGSYHVKPVMKRRWLCI